MSSAPEPDSEQRLDTPDEAPDEAQVAADSRLLVRRGFALLRDAVRREPRSFAVALLGSTVYALMTVASAAVLGRITDRVIFPAFRSGHTTAGALAAAAGAIFGVATVKAAGITVRRSFAGRVEYGLQGGFRRDLTRQYLRLPLRWHRAHPTGELLSVANSDVEALAWPISPLPFAVGVLLMLVGTVVMLVLLDPVLAAVGLLVLPSVFLINAGYNRLQAPLAARAQQLRGELAAVAHESFDGALVVKTLGREEAETERFRAVANRLRDTNVRLGYLRGVFDPVMNALPTVGVLLVLWFGADRVAAGRLTPGDLVKAAYLFILVGFPIRAIGWVLADLPRAVVGRMRVERVLSATGALTTGGERLAAEPDAVRLGLDAVRFGYLEEAEVLRDLSLDVSPGTTVAVVGPTGSGKSTLAGLLVRLADPLGGAVRYDGTALPHLATGEVSRVAALVAQSTFLFDDTVRGNVALGADVDDQEVWEALRLAQADGFVSVLPHGLDTRLGERGTTLSGGQRQRLALARALVRKPRLLILDDATSSVDPEVEQAILGGLREALVGDLDATVVVVAYRQATIGLADEVVYVEAGRVVARGSHERLLAEVPGYAALATAYDRAARERAAERAAAPR